MIDTATGREAPSQRVVLDGRAYLRVWTENVPPSDTKRDEIAPGAAGGFDGRPTAGGNILENDRYRLVALGPTARFSA